MLETAKAASYWHPLENGKIQCDLCPHFCQLQEGQRGLCYIRGVENQQMQLYSYGRSSGFCLDPIEKKPLNHFLPGTSVLSFGTAGCNLTCKFCQNWDMSKSRKMQTLASNASPETLAKACLQTQARSIAYTYNDPVIFIEYALDVAAACREVDVKSVAVSAGFISDKAREPFFASMDAANIDLKGFSKTFYKKLCGADLDIVKETLIYLAQKQDTWLEVTNLIIPGENDSEEELTQMCEWYSENLGCDVPLHFSAFHPDYKMLKHPRTPIDTLLKARNIARKSGLHFVYTGNVSDPASASTYCPNCESLLIERDRYQLGRWELDEKGQCKKCQHLIAGVFEKQAGNWGAKRQVLRFVD